MTIVTFTLVGFNVHNLNKRRSAEKLLTESDSSAPREIETKNPFKKSGSYVRDPEFNDLRKMFYQYGVDGHGTRYAAERIAESKNDSDKYYGNMRKAQPGNKDEIRDIVYAVMVEKTFLPEIRKICFHNIMIYRISAYNNFCAKAGIDKNVDLKKLHDLTKTLNTDEISKLNKAYFDGMYVYLTNKIEVKIADKEAADKAKNKDRSLQELEQPDPKQVKSWEREFKNLDKKHS